MKFAIAATFAALLATTAYAQAPVGTCKAQSATKKLAGAAEKSFLTKCETDAKTSCETSAKEKKLAGAAMTSHVTKCVKDTVGS